MAETKRNQRIKNVFENTACQIPSELIDYANNNMYFTKNKFRNIKVGIAVTNELCKETGYYIKCFYCPITRDGFGICDNFQITKYNKKNLKDFQENHLRRHHLDIFEKKRYKICVVKSFEETIDIFKKKREQRLDRYLKEKFPKKITSINNINSNDNEINNTQNYIINATITNLQIPTNYRYYYECQYYIPIYDNKIKMLEIKANKLFFG